MTDPALTLATLLSLALAVVFYVRARRAERARDQWKRNSDAWEKLYYDAEKDVDELRVRLADSLDEIAELRDGGNAAE